MSIGMTNECILCLLNRHLTAAEKLGSKEAAGAFARDLLRLYADTPMDISTPELTDRVNELYVKRLAKTLQTMIILPNFLSMAVVAIIAYAFLKGGNTGILNQVVRAFGGKMRDWYMYKPVWPFLLVFINAWRGVGYGSIVYVASISGISQEYYEAAVLDGASKFQQALYVTLPHLRKIITIMLIMSVGSLLKGDFGLFYNVTQNNGALYEVTDVIDTYIYRARKLLGDTGMSSAAGLYQSFVGLLLVLLANWVVTKVDEESSMF